MSAREKLTASLAPGAVRMRRKDTNVTMAVHLGKEILECREHAADCARKAQRAAAESARADFLRLERNWLQLARSYEFAQRLLGDKVAANPRDINVPTPRSGLQ